MKLKGLIDEDFVNYKKPSMFIITPYCDGKCNKGYDTPICQNYNLYHDEDSLVEIDTHELVKRYIDNPITHAVVFGGLEPFESGLDLLDFVYLLRAVNKCDDDVVIYTGFTEDELQYDHIFNSLRKDFTNIIVKFGRYIPNQEAHYDDILGVKLISNNQYAKKIS